MYTVYLVDDEKWLLESLFKSIDWSKYNTTVVGKATKSIEAFDEIQAIQPDIVITDVRMPNMNGLELMTKLRERSCKSAFIILSGYAEFEYVRQALQNEAVSYCLKPFEESNIIEALKRAQDVCSKRELVEALQGGCEHQPISANETFQKICTYIKHNFTTNMTLQEIADKFFLNPSYLSNLFKKELGLNYSTYLATIRIDYACELLMNTQLSINQIADQIGFKNYFYFARVFKKYKNMTPSQYRDSMQDRSVI